MRIHTAFGHFQGSSPDQEESGAEERRKEADYESTGTGRGSSEDLRIHEVVHRRYGSLQATTRGTRTPKSAASASHHSRRIYRVSFCSNEGACGSGSGSAASPNADTSTPAGIRAATSPDSRLPRKYSSGDKVHKKAKADSGA